MGQEHSHSFTSLKIGRLHASAWRDYPAQYKFFGLQINASEEKIVYKRVSFDLTALLAHLEARGGSDEAKNALSVPAPHPDTPEDGIRTTCIFLQNRKRWEADRDIARWLSRARLFGDSGIGQYTSYWGLAKWMAKNLSRLPQLRGVQERTLQAHELMVSKL